MLYAFCSCSIRRSKFGNDASASAASSREVNVSIMNLSTGAMDVLCRSDKLYFVSTARSTCATVGMRNFGSKHTCTLHICCGPRGALLCCTAGFDSAASGRVRLSGLKGSGGGAGAAAAASDSGLMSKAAVDPSKKDALAATARLRCDSAMSSVLGSVRALGCDRAHL